MISCCHRCLLWPHGVGLNPREKHVSWDRHTGQGLARAAAGPGLSYLLSPQARQASLPDTTDDPGHVAGSEGMHPAPPPPPHSPTVGGCLGVVSSSPFTRAMFRPLPTLSFTGLMILKKKRKKKCDSGSPVWNELLQDSGLGQGPRAARQSNRKCPAGLRPCFLRDPGGGLGSRGVTRGLSGPEQSAQRKGPGSPLLSVVSLGALASISGRWISGPPSLPGLNSRAPCASGHRAGQAQPAPWGPLRGNSDGKLSPPWGAGWGPCADQLWPPCCPHAEACLR